MSKINNNRDDKIKTRTNYKKGREKLLYVSFMILGSIGIALLVLYSSFIITFNDKEFYEKELAKTSQIENSIEIKKEVTGFLKGQDNNIALIGFNEREIEHLNDVKKLLQETIIFMIFLGGFIIIELFILFWKTKNPTRAVSKILIFSSITGFLFIGLFLVMGINFEYFFNLFHPLFFYGDSWLFYPTDLIINVYTVEFFFLFGKQMLYFSTVILSFLMIIGMILLLISNKRVTIKKG